MSNLNRVIAGLSAAALCVSLAACGGAGAQGGDVAAVNGQKISRTDFDKKLESSPVGKQVLTQLVQQQLVEQYAKDKHIDVAQADIDKKEADIKSKYPAGQFEQILKTQGLTEADVQNILRQQVIIEKAVAPNVHVGEAEIKSYFDKNRSLYDTAEQVRARHILVPDEKTANDVLKQLKGGAKFEDLSKKYSTDAASKDKGGELGFFGRNQMVKPFEAAAFSAKIGQTIGPVKSTFGYHIIQVEEKKPATKATLAATHDKIRDQLTQQQQSQQFPLFLQQLRTNAKIEIYDARYADAFPSPLPTPPPAAAGSAAPAASAPAASAPAAAPAPASSAK